MKCNLMVFDVFAYPVTGSAVTPAHWYIFTIISNSIVCYSPKDSKGHETVPVSSHRAFKNQNIDNGLILTEEVAKNRQNESND